MNMRPRMPCGRQDLYKVLPDSQLTKFSHLLLAWPLCDDVHRANPRRQPPFGLPDPERTGGTAIAKVVFRPN